MEYVDVNASERGVSAVDSETSGAPAVVEEYQNLWLSEDDPRAIPLPDARLICPTHHIACKKGICEDMSKILRDIKKEKLKAEWEEKMKNKGIRFMSFSCHCFLTFLQARKRRRLRGAVITIKPMSLQKLMEITSLSLVRKATEDVLGNIKRTKMRQKSMSLHILDA